MKCPRLHLTGTDCAKIIERQGLFVIEPMRFVSLSQARRDAFAANYDRTPWCPREFKPLYRRLREKGFSAAEARPMVEETIAKGVAA